MRTAPLLLSFVMFATATSLSALDGFLLPVATAVPGRFAVEAYVDNEGSGTVAYRAHGCSPEGDCAYFNYSSIDGASQRLFIKPPSDRGTAILWFQSGFEDARVTLRAKSLTHPDVGTFIPAVRLDDLRTSTVVLAHVPVASPYWPPGIFFRKTLRVYAPLSTRREPFKVRVLREQIGAPASFRRLLDEFILETEPATDLEGDLPSTPGFRRVDGFWDAPELPIAADPFQVRVEISPLNAGTRFWAFISVTQNDSDKILLILPE